MAESGAKEFFAKKLESVRDAYLKDLEAMSPEQLSRSVGGTARTPYDFTYETIFVNKRVSKRLRGETPEPMGDDDGWMKAPTEFCYKDKAVLEFRDSMDEIIAALHKIDESKLLDPITLPSGETSFMNLAYFACIHNTYHDAQLNYVQALHGDDSMHW